MLVKQWLREKAKPNETTSRRHMLPMRHLMVVWDVKVVPENARLK